MAILILMQSNLLMLNRSKSYFFTTKVIEEGEHNSDIVSIVRLLDDSVELGAGT